MRQLPLNLSQVWLVQCKLHEYRQFSPYEFKHALKKLQSLFTNISKVKKIYETEFSASENLKCHKALNEKKWCCCYLRYNLSPSIPPYKWNTHQCVGMSYSSEGITGNSFRRNNSGYKL